MTRVGGVLGGVLFLQKLKVRKTVKPQPHLRLYYICGFISGRKYHDNWEKLFTRNLLAIQFNYN